MRSRRLAAVFASMLATGLVASASTIAQRRDPSTPAPAPAQDGHVVEELRTTWRFENDGRARREVYERVKVQSEAGLDRWGQLTFDYNSANERLDVIFVRVRKADGTVVTATPDAVQDLSSPVQREAPVYTDTREKHVTVPGLRPGETLEYQVATTVHTPLAPGHFWAEYDFAKTGVVLDEELTIEVPNARAIMLKTRDGFAPTITDADDRRVYRWRSAHIAAETDGDSKEDKPKKPKEQEPAAVRLTTFENWDAVGRWYAELERPQRMPTADIRRKAKELVAGRTSDLDKLEALYTYVAENFRYVSLSFGVGRYQPHAAADILHNQYGDCKDKHTLLASLGESIGLHASAVLVHSRLKLDPDFPSPTQFDHVITRVAVGGTDVWVDTTTEVAPFRLLMPTLRKKQVLVVDQGSAHLALSPNESPVPNTSTFRIEGTVDDSGSLKAKGHLELRGDAELLFRMMFRRYPRAAWKTMVDGFAAGADLGDRVTTWDVSDPADTREPFLVDYEVTKPNFAAWTKRHFDLDLPWASFISARSAGDDGSDGEIEIGPPQHTRYEIRLTLPASYEGRAPLAVSVMRDYGEYRSAYALERGVFTAERVLDVKRASIPSTHKDDYAAFRRVVSRDVAQILTVENAAAATGAAPANLNVDELAKSAKDALDAGNNSQAVALFRRVVELKPTDGSAWNDLGRAYLALHDDDAAIEALTTQVGINPYHANAYNNLGRAYHDQRRFEDGERAFLKQLEVNPLHNSAHGSLGRLYLDWGRYEAAQSELEKAVALSPKDAPLQISLGEAYLNLGANARAMAAFDRAVELDASPTTWNNVAYRLALKRVDLDRAERYAESAVAAISAGARNLSVEHVTARDLWHVTSLASYWDTLGWVLYAKGNAAAAERFVKASWVLAQHPEVGDHLAQIYKDQGRRDEAIGTYALALSVKAPDERIRARLAELVGKDHVADVVKRCENELVARRTAALDAAGPAGGTADFFVLFNHDGAVESVRFITGDERLRGMSDSVRAAKYMIMFPDDTPAKVLRRGTVTCSSAGACTIVMRLPAEAQALQQY
jgi:Flp pilus assembly protein TadD/transglutaminase-like putative cysteine protease